MQLFLFVNKISFLFNFAFSIQQILRRDIFCLFADPILTNRQDKPPPSSTFNYDWDRLEA